MKKVLASIVFVLTLFFFSGTSYAVEKPSSIFDNMPDFKKFREEEKVPNPQPDSIYNHREPLKTQVTYPSNSNSEVGILSSGPSSSGFLDSVPYAWQNYFVIFILAVLFVVIVAVIVYFFRRAERKATP
jgi:predicted PurR-regulated permease PerM